MENFEFYNPVRIIFGSGEILKVGKAAKEIGKKAILVSYEDQGSLQNSIKKIEKIIKEQNVDYVKFYKITPNPKLNEVKKGIDLCKAENVDMVIGIGGGSAMDAAKIIAAGVYYKEDLWKMVITKHSQEISIPPEKALPMLMIPTLPATSSEMNNIAVLSNADTKEKSYVYNDCLFPKVSILDPGLTCSLPPYQTALGAADTISHILEFYLNGYRDAPMQNRFQEGVILTIMENVKIALKDPNNLSARSNLMWCSSVANNGWAQPGDGWTPMHQIGHVLTARYKIPHGASLSIVMPAWMKKLYKKRIEQYEQLAERVFKIDIKENTKDSAILKSINKFEHFLKEIGVPVRLSEYGIEKNNLNDILNDVVRISFGIDGKLKCRPPVTKDEIFSVLVEAL